jgi:hypothetical protein
LASMVLAVYGWLTDAERAGVRRLPASGSKKPQVTALA